MPAIRITVIRSAQVQRIAPRDHQADLMRGLTAEGEAGARRLRTRLENPEYDLIVTSDAIRSVHTARLLANRGSHEMLKVPELYPEPGTPAFEAVASMKIEFGPFKLYREHAQSAPLLEHGRLALTAVFTAVERLSSRNVLVVGHNPFISAMGYAASEGRPGAMRVFDRSAFVSASGYILTFTELGKLKYIKFANP